MKFEPVTKLDKKNKKLTIMSCWKIVSNSEESGSQIPDALSVKLILSKK